jgi:NodT family efflux transporter outer membrane factor (OMF) lipoprotein
MISMNFWLRSAMILLLALVGSEAVRARAATDWWQQLGDTVLNRLMDEALSRNHEVQMAEERIRQARAAYRAQLGALAPQVTLGAGWVRSRSSQRLTHTLLPSTLESYYDGRVSASWTVDLFGQLRKAAEAQRAAYRAAQAERQVVLLTLSKEVATDYLSLCAMRRMVRVVSDNITSQREIVRLTQVRYEAGLESKLDVAQALSTLYNTEAGITTYRSDEASYRYQLAVLLATTPDALTPLLVDADSLPTASLSAFDLNGSLSADSIPIDWGALRQRPDLRQQEWVIDEQASLLGAARKAWLPTFLIDGQWGIAAHTPGRMWRHESTTWQVAPIVQWTVFNGGARCADIRRTRAQLQEQVDNYNELLLTAMQQVESATTACREGWQQVQHLRAAVLQAEESLRLSLELYKMGLTAFINVMQAQQSVLQYQTALVTAELATWQQAVALWVAQSPGVNE